MSQTNQAGPSPFADPMSPAPAPVAKAPGSRKGLVIAIMIVSVVVIIGLVVAVVIS